MTIQKSANFASSWAVSGVQTINFQSADTTTPSVVAGTVTLPSGGLLNFANGAAVELAGTVTGGLAARWGSNPAPW